VDFSQEAIPNASLKLSVFIKRFDFDFDNVIRVSKIGLFVFGDWLT